MKVINGGRNAANGVDKIYIGRGTPFGNPFKIGVDGNRKEVIKKFKLLLNQSKQLQQDIQQLKGKTLVCHCKPKACHGDVIIEYLQAANIIQWKLI